MKINLSDIPLFSGCGEEELGSFLFTERCPQKAFLKGELLVRQGEIVRAAGILISGSVKAYHLTTGGEERIHNILSAGDMFGYVLMSSHEKRSPVYVEAIEDCEALFVPLDAMLKTTGSCATKIRLNLLNVLSSRCQMLADTINYLSERTIRGRICGYLLSESERYHSDSFNMPISRDSMAKLLCVNRCALSRELSHMQKDALIKFHQNSFAILNKDALIHYIEHETN